MSDNDNEEVTPEEQARAQKAIDAAEETSRRGWYMVGGQVLLAVNPYNSSEVWTYYIDDGVWRRKGEADRTDLPFAADPATVETPTELTAEDTIEKQILVTCQVSPCDEPVAYELASAAALHAISYAVRHFESNGFVHDAADVVSIGIIGVEDRETPEAVTPYLTRAVKIVRAAARFRQAKLATGQCTDLLKSRRDQQQDPDKAAQIMNEFLDAQERLMEACALSSAMTPLEAGAGNAPRPAGAVEEGHLVVLKVDNTPAEDEAYTVGTFLVPADRVEKFSAEAVEARGKLIEQNDGAYEDNDLVQHLVDLGWQQVDPPTEIVLP